MAIKRDDGNFAHAAQRVLLPLLTDLGYGLFNAGLYIRPRGPWWEAFQLRQSTCGTGSFCINIGLCVTALVLALAR